MRNLITAHLLMLLVLVAATPAAAQQPQPDSHLLSTSVGTPTYDRSGRLSQMETARYDAAGVLTGSSLASYTWDQGKLVTSRYESFDAEELLVSSVSTRWEYPGGDVLRKGSRVFRNGREEVLHTETELWTNDAKARILTVQTERFSHDGALAFTRYQVTERNETGLIISRDLSTIGADGRQTYRMFESWGHEDGRIALIQRYRYNDTDELFERDCEEWFYDESGRVASMATTRYDANDAVLQLVVEERYYTRSKLDLRRVTFMTPDHIPTRRLTVSVAYTDSGALLTRRSSWEIFEEL